MVMIQNNSNYLTDYYAVNIISDSYPFIVLLEKILRRVFLKTLKENKEKKCKNIQVKYDEFIFSSNILK